VFARQPCHHIQNPLDVGQWLCVPPFRMVCPFRDKTLVSLPVCLSKRHTSFLLPANTSKNMRLQR
jgi:hypothetical protein